jgi:signal transduction histidine kinase
VSNALALVEEQAALRRVATLLARGSTLPDVIQSVTGEVGRLLRADATGIFRHERGGVARALGGWPSQADDVRLVAVGERITVAGAASHAAWDGDAVIAALTRDLRWTSSIAAPIVVDKSPWGFVAAASRRRGVFTPDVERRLAAFTELVSIAIVNAEARAEVARLTDEQAALRRVATLVAEGAPAESVFDQVAREVAVVLDIDKVTIDRYNGDESSTVVASLDPVFPLGSTWPLDGPSLGATVLHEARASRLDDYTGLESTVATVARESEVTSAVGVPIVVDDAIWGVICVGAHGEDRLPADTEQRLAAFSELVETTISNTQRRAEVIASRARIAAAADETRKRIEHELREGLQQRVFAVQRELAATADSVPAEHADLRELLASAAVGLADVASDLGDIAQGIRPASLAAGGLTPALTELARRSAVPVQLALDDIPRLPDRVEAAAYYVASEALTNTVKHAGADEARIVIDGWDPELAMTIADNGVGGATVERGSGLVGLRDRVEALGGTLRIESLPGRGTTLAVAIPCAPPLRSDLSDRRASAGTSSLSQR